MCRGRGVGWGGVGEAGAGAQQVQQRTPHSQLWSACLPACPPALLLGAGLLVLLQLPHPPPPPRPHPPTCRSLRACRLPPL